MMKSLDKRYFLKAGLFESTDLATDKVYFAHQAGPEVTRFIKFKLVTPTAVEIIAHDTLENIKHAALFPHIFNSGKHTGLEFQMHANPKTQVEYATIGDKPYLVVNPMPLSDYPVFKGLKNKIWVDGEHEFKDFIREEK
ncbi:MAG: hypothetical protein JHC33_00640 [Ignisphaera sp.]|nr:hypothetical protein [Ignisphaera sp.]